MRRLEMLDFGYLTTHLKTNKISASSVVIILRQIHIGSRHCPDTDFWSQPKLHQIWTSGLHIVLMAHNSKALVVWKNVPLDWKPMTWTAPHPENKHPLLHSPVALWFQLCYSVPTYTDPSMVILDRHNLK